MTAALQQDQDLFEMTNLYPRHTGLPMTVWVSPRGHARHHARIKVCVDHGDRMVADRAVVVAIAPRPHLVVGTLSSDDQRQIFAWISLNSQALLSFWTDGDAVRLLSRLKKLTERP
jgi:hypothetical protein